MACVELRPGATDWRANERGRLIRMTAGLSRVIAAGGVGSCFGLDTLKVANIPQKVGRFLAQFNSRSVSVEAIQVNDPLGLRHSSTSGVALSGSGGRPGGGVSGRDQPF